MGAVQLFILPKHESQCSQGEQNYLVQSSAVNMLSHFLIENLKKNCRRQVAKPWSTFGQAYKFQNMKKYISNQKVICAHILILICMLEAPMDEFYKKKQRFLTKNGICPCGKSSIDREGLSSF